MSQAEVPDIQSIVGPTVGALLIGVLFSVWWSSQYLSQVTYSYKLLWDSLFGANTLQTWYYYQHYPKDNMFLQMLVREFANLQHVSRLICPIGRLRASGRSVTISSELSWTIPVRIFEVLHAIFECHAIYFYLVQNFNNIPGLDITSWYEPIIMFTLFICLLILPCRLTGVPQ